MTLADQHRVLPPPVSASEPRVPTWQDFERYIMAVNRVDELLLRVTRALDAAGLDYAVIGGNAVAAWVSTVDPEAIRNTKDVDLLVRRKDLGRIAVALHPAGLVPAEVLGVSMFVDEKNPSPKTGVHLIFASERIRPDDKIKAPDIADAKPGVRGFRVLPLLDLVKMKLIAFRLRDQTHLVDLFLTGLIDASWKAKLPTDLQPRFQQMIEAFESEKSHQPDQGRLP